MNRGYMLAALSAGVLAFQPVAARAAFVGSTIEWQYYFNGGEYTYGTNHGTFTVQRAGMLDGVFNDGEVTYFGIHTDHDTITFRYHPTMSVGWGRSRISLRPTIHNGVALNLTSAGAFISVQIDPSTNMKGFDASRISFSKHQIQVDWQGLRYNPDTIVRLDVKVR